MAAIFIFDEHVDEHFYIWWTSLHAIIPCCYIVGLKQLIWSFIFSNFRVYDTAKISQKQKILFIYLLN